MQHGKGKRKFGRNTKLRQAMMIALAGSLIQHGKIKTTEAKAKELKPYIEKLITKSRLRNLPITKSFNDMFSSEIATKLIKEIGPKFNDRNGGYTRIRHLSQRISDGAKMAVIEFIE